MWGAALWSGLISLVVAVAVSLLLGPLRVRWEEAARRDTQVRHEIREHLVELMLALHREIIRRRMGPDAEGKLTYVRFNELLLPVARALENPDLSPKVRAELEPRLVRLVGSERLRYLALVDRHYLTEGHMAHSGEQLGDLRDPALFPLIFGHTQRYPHSATLIDEMLHLKDSKEESVKHVIDVLEECLRAARLRRLM